MYLLPDGTDLRLCRLAMMGCALSAGSGRPLRGPAEGSAALELMVEPAVHRQWLAGGRGPAEAGGASELVSTGLRFASILEAAIFVHEWARRHSPGWRFTREDVCCRHVCPDSQAAACSCWWLESATGRAEPGRGLVAGGGWVAGEGWVAGLVAAACLHEQEVNEMREGFERTRDEWLQLGAVF